MLMLFTNVSVQEFASCLISMYNVHIKPIYVVL
uniref:Uncharacterized protein n=1 Tax=Anguilla anguilla TaxID=7936 RepID=A0A0E9T1A0_ANGAN